MHHEVSPPTCARPFRQTHEIQGNPRVGTGWDRAIQQVWGRGASHRAGVVRPLSLRHRRAKGETGSEVPCTVSDIGDGWRCWSSCLEAGGLHAPGTWLVQPFLIPPVPPLPLACADTHRYYGSFLKGSHLWIIMEYCAGGSCSDLVSPDTKG